MGKDIVVTTRALCATLLISFALSCDTRSNSVTLEGDVFVTITEGEITPNQPVQSEYSVFLQTPEGKYQIHLNDKTEFMDVEYIELIYKGGHYRIKGVSYTPDQKFIELPRRGGKFLGFIRASEVRKLEKE